MSDQFFLRLALLYYSRTSCNSFGRRILDFIHTLRQIKPRNSTLCKVSVPFWLLITLVLAIPSTWLSRFHRISPSLIPRDLFLRKVSNLFSTPGPTIFTRLKLTLSLFFGRLRLKAHFQDQTSVSHKDVFEATNRKKSFWSPPESSFGSLDNFIRQCRHEIDQLPKFRPKRPSNPTPLEFEALKSLRCRTDIAIKPADKGGDLVVWRADLYRKEAHRKLSDTSFYRRVDEDLTFHHQCIVRSTVHQLVSSGELPQSSSLNLLTNTPRIPVIYFLPKIQNPYNPRHVMAPLVKDLPSYIKDTKHALQIIKVHIKLILLLAQLIGLKKYFGSFLADSDLDQYFPRYFV